MLSGHEMLNAINDVGTILRGKMHIPFSSFNNNS